MYTYNIILIAVFLILSAFFSGMEAALFSLSRFRIKTLLFEDQHGARTIQRLKQESGNTLATILLANLIVNIGCSSIAALLLLRLVSVCALNLTVAYIMEFVIMTSLILLIGEITPKTIAVANAESLSLRFGGVIRVLSAFFSPITRLMVILTKRISEQQGTYDTISDSELRYMLREARQFNVLDDREVRFGYRILKFGKIRVDEIMTPRHDVISVSANATLEKARALVIDEKHSRICVLDDKGDIVGLLYAKDLFVHLVNNPNSGTLPVRDLVRDPYIVQETKRAETLLAEFRKNGIHCGIVVDEFGYFTGIVTLEDILESIFGEIVDEYDEYGVLDDIPYRKIKEDTFLFNGNVRIGELSAVLEIEPFADESERLGGFLFQFFKRIPEEEETIILPGVEITVKEVRDRAIEQVLVRKRKG